MNDTPDAGKEMDLQPGLMLGGEPAMTASPYRVLARKYRPSTFDDLIGQEPMVRTVSNAFEAGRIPQAWILTGVRGVGKTTTARILARALNYELPDGSVTGPTIHMPRLGLHCQAIMESRHIDVLEMDAASHTGIDDVRQITDGVRYAPSSARYKVYIIDEVHMLSEKAFNAFLKTLEEPPPHAKFVFATTEIRKVPVTVLSRCQRFDLRRVDVEVLIRHLASIAEREKVAIESDALKLIARAAEGSVRDSLSLLDQAIAHAAGEVRAEDVRQMLGLADRARIIDLFGYLASGQIAEAFEEFRAQYDTGADPVVILSDLAEFVNFVTRVKAVPASAESSAYSQVERERGRSFAAGLSMRVLSRMWQMLLKGIAEVQGATRPVSAAEMVMVRMAYAADLPTPDEALRLLEAGGGDMAVKAGGAAPSSGLPSSRSERASPSVMSSSPLPRAQATTSSSGNHGAPLQMRHELARQAEQQGAAPVLRIADYAQLIALAADQRDLQIKAALERDIRLVRLEDGHLIINLMPRAPHSLINDLSRKLTQWTGRKWLVALSNEDGAPTLREQRLAEKDDLRRRVESDEHVRAVMSKFPGAHIVDVRQVEKEQFDNSIEADTDIDND